MRLIFAGTPAVALPTLTALAGSAHDIVGIITRPPAPVGRKRILTPSPVAVAAGDGTAPLIETARLDETATEKITELRPELGVVVAYGGLVREPLLTVPTHGWINLHFSLLPRWRGAAPVAHALLAGDKVTGATVFRLVDELDAGPIYATIEHPVTPTDTAGTVLAALADTGAALVTQVVDAIAAGNMVPTPQVGTPSFAPKLTAEDGRIDWTADAAVVLNRFRGTTPEPGAFTTTGGARLKILQASPSDELVTLPPGHIEAGGTGVRVGTGTSPILIERVQPAGKSAMSAADWFRGLRQDVRVLGE